MKISDAVTRLCAVVAIVLAVAVAPVPVDSTQASPGLVESTGMLRAAFQVDPGQTVTVRGRVPAALARGRVTVLRHDGGTTATVASGRADARGRYVLETHAPLATGSYAHDVRVARSGKARTVKRFTISVVSGTKAPITTTTTPAPTFSQGDPNDWTYLGGTRVARWDPCSAITWSVTGTAPYAEASTDIQTALDRLATATGLRFVQVADAGTSTLDITWTNAAAEPRLAGTVVGLGGFSSYAPPIGPSQIASGYVLLDQEHTIPGGFTTVGSSWGKVLLHETSHALGLGHAAGIEQIMYPQVVLSPAELGAGDLTGLAAVGAGQGCFTSPVQGRTSVQARTVDYVD
ncbi:matrixin family metalloprotease [Nocardioides currus]|uniref:Peptidase metallopeptidase domain-containing protein n=1 Tax=Nocardioides currus TaxID=2133958 RepID=A0A2R7Z2V5_9ACTN|nr:matrixin family metalloprotease [Nocardioides currus]PUA82912.1 hypothetical protein C7S10_04240 [Nocardioides currus]